MTSRLSTALVIAAIVIAATLLYATRLGFAPIYIMHDESQFALQSQAIAATGHDLSGTFMPVFFTEPEFPAGRDPMIIYATALVLKVLPFSEASARLATALVGVLDIVLVFLVARAAFASTGIGLVAAGALALTPAHFIRARLVLSPLYSIPFVLLWLLSMIEFERQPRVTRLAIAGAWLGIGLYTYLACVIMMPIYLAVTCIWAYRVLHLRAATIAVATFVAVLLPMLAWYATHPERFQQIFGAYKLYSEAAQMPALQGVQTRLALYWSFFNPQFLFISGDSSMINSTRHVGFFPLAFAVLIPAGLWVAWKSGRPALWIIALGFVTAPLASIISGAIEMNRIMFAMPFGALAATCGFAFMMRGRPWARIVALLLIASVPWQFTRFYADYMGAYRVQSSKWFGGNIREAIATVIRGQPENAEAPIYISRSIPFANRYWRFYAIAAGREELVDAPAYFAGVPDEAKPGSWVICQSSAAECQAMHASGHWRLVATAEEPDRTPSFDVLVRAGDVRNP